MNKLLLILAVFLSISIAKSQENNNLILVNERTIDRPLTMHKGQLQVNAAYNFGIIAANFDESGNKTDLAELGIASVLHEYMFDIHYGIFDFLEFQTAINYSKRAERSVGDIIISGFDPAVYVNTINNYEGFDDLLIATNVSYSFFDGKLDISLNPGLFLPIFSNVPDEPEHSMVQSADLGGYTTVDYKYNHKVSKGSSQLKLGANAKFRTKNFAISGLFEKIYPLGISESVTWYHQFIGNDFEYRDETFNFLTGDITRFIIKAEYQALPWLNLNINYSSFSSKNGWSEETGLRLANSKMKLSSAVVGYEIKITEKIWLTQFIFVPIMGENEIAPLSFITGLSYNLFPFSN